MDYRKIKVMSIGSNKLVRLITGLMGMRGPLDELEVQKPYYLEDLFNGNLLEEFSDENILYTLEGGAQGYAFENFTTDVADLEEFRSSLKSTYNIFLKFYEKMKEGNSNYYFIYALGKRDTVKGKPTKQLNEIISSLDKIGVLSKTIFIGSREGELIEDGTNKIFGNYYIDDVEGYRNSLPSKTFTYMECEDLYYKDLSSWWGDKDKRVVALKFLEKFKELEVAA